MNTRPAAVADMFYPGTPQQIQQFIESCNVTSSQAQASQSIPRALIVPHAGYIYSGCAAWQGFKLWQGAGEKIKTVVIIGPAHRVGFKGVATVSVDAFATPLGSVPVDAELQSELLEKHDILGVSDVAHQQEHSLEVQLPFIQTVLPKAKILPLLNGNVESTQVFNIIKELWKKSGVYFVISSDLSHFHDYANAQEIDHQTAQLIEQNNWQDLNGERACGYRGIQGLLQQADANRIQVDRVALLNSGDTAGDKSRVVGYGTWALYE